MNVVVGHGEIDRLDALGVGLECLRDHHRAKIAPPDPNVDHTLDWLAWATNGERNARCGLENQPVCPFQVPERTLSVNAFMRACER